MGVQQESKGSTNYDVWYAPVLIARYSATDKMRIAARGEYYTDKGGVIIPTGTANGFQTYGYSLNVDYLPTRHVVLRVEGRGLMSKDHIFTSDGQPSNQNYFITTSIAMTF